MKHEFDLTQIDVGTKAVVLIVEDDDAILAIVKRYLETEGCLVFTAETAIEAMIKLKLLQPVECPDMILTDINLPYNGGKLIDTLNQIPTLEKVPIIPMSSNGMSYISKKKVLAKPLDLKVLLDRVKEAIAQSPYHRNKPTNK